MKTVSTNAIYVRIPLVRQNTIIIVLIGTVRIIRIVTFTKNIHKMTIFLKRQKVYCFLTFKKLTFLPKYGIMSINYEGVVPHSSLHMCELNQQHAVRLV